MRKHFGESGIMVTAAKVSIRNEEYWWHVSETLISHFTLFSSNNNVVFLHISVNFHTKGQRKWEAIKKENKEKNSSNSI